jgi:hypothetical protein
MGARAGEAGVGCGGWFLPEIYVCDSHRAGLLWCVVSPSVIHQRPAMMKRNRQVSVPLPDELREQLERVAAEQDRTLAAQIRHLVVQSLRGAQSEEHAA